MQAIQTLTNHFLIAMPSMADPHFSHAVIYICEHTENGAIGIIVNRPLQHLRLQDVFEQVEISSDYPHVNEMPVLYGGPVQQERGFVLHTPAGQWQSTLSISEHMSVTTSKDILEAMAKEQGPMLTTVALGYAGWGAGQLEEELKENSWLATPPSDDILFTLPFSQRWEAAAALLGIDINALSGDVGNA